MRFMLTVYLAVFYEMMGLFGLDFLACGIRGVAYKEGLVPRLLLVVW